METEQQTPETAQKEANEREEMEARLAEVRQERRPRHPDPSHHVTRDEPSEVEIVDPSREAISKAAAGELEKDDPEQEAALDFLLRSFQEDEHPELEHLLRVNVGTPTRPKLIHWRVKPLPGALIRKIREDAEESVRRRTGGRQQPTGIVNAGFEANLRVVVEGSVDPDIKDGARQVGLADPGDFLQMALNQKQLLIDQIAGVILTLSGGDEEDVQDELEVTAAKNSSS